MPSRLTLNDLEVATIGKLNAEKKAYLAEARYHNMQTTRLERSRANEDSLLESQRVLDFTSEVGYGNVRAAINTLAEWRQSDPGAPITIRLLTPGGDAIAGLAFYDYMRLLVNEGVEVTTMAIGMAASMGAVLLQGGSKRVITSSAMLMVHEVANIAAGKLSELVDEVKFAERIQNRLLDILADRSTLTARQIKRRWTRKDWWMDADEAVSLGFADEVAAAL
jgi:ATP-dependent Clp endopeptidase proteolytic subunit ClpP